jgi:hypothetical protein
VVGSSRYWLTIEQRSPSVENKLDSIMARLDRLCSEEDSDDALRGDNEDERWVKLFEWVARTNPHHGRADSLLALSSRSGTTGKYSTIASPPRATRNARTIFWLFLEWRKISEMPSSTTRLVTAQLTQPLCY